MKKGDLKRVIFICLPIGIGVVMLGSLFWYGYMRFAFLSKQIENLAQKLSASNDLFLSKTDALSQDLLNLDHKAVGLSDALYIAEQTIEANKNNFEQTVGKISGTVNTLEKLSKTDPELLQKYSKVYFLNENYIPERLTEIPKEYVFSDRSMERIHTLVWPHLKDLLDGANTDGAVLSIESAYRSFAEQKSLKSLYIITYGAGTAHQFSADQGYSEHQLGTAVDFTTTSLGLNLFGFEKTQAYQWMQNSAHTYGFVLSYPAGNGYFIFEPWHWRYVGVKLATFLHDQNKHFYDLEQRDIDMYLVDIFD